MPPSQIRLTSLKNLLVRTYRVTRERMAALLSIGLIGAGATATLVFLPAGIAYLWGGATQEIRESRMLIAALAGAAAGIGGAVWTILAFIALLTEPGAGPWRSFERAREMFVSSLWLGALMAAFILGGALFVIPGVIFLAWFVCAPFVLATDEMGGTRALHQSRAYAQGRVPAVALRVMIPLVALLLAGVVPVIGIVLVLALIPPSIVYAFLLFLDLKREREPVIAPFSERARLLAIGAGTAAASLTLAILVSGVWQKRPADAFARMAWWKPPSPRRAEVLSWGRPGNGDGEFFGPNAIAVDAAGFVYVAGDDIQKFDADGGFITRWSRADHGTDLVSPAGIAVGGGRVLVTDAFNRVVIYDADGGYVNRWGSAGTAPGEFHWSNGIAVNKKGEVYVVDTHNTRVQKFSPAGHLLAMWGSAGSADGQFFTPSGIAIDRTDHVYIADTGNGRIQKFDSEGAFLTAWGAPGSKDGEFQGLYAVAVDTAGFVYASDAGNNRVQKFDSDGRFLAAWAGSHDTLLALRGPRGVAVSSNGMVFILDHGNNRVVRVPAASPLWAAAPPASPTSAEAN